MPVLSFPCVVTRLKDRIEVCRRRIWIKGHDLRALAVAATEQLGFAPKDCEYAFFSPDTAAPAGVFLDVVRNDGSAIVGPMGGPTPTPDVLPDHCYPLDDLLSRLGFRPQRNDNGNGEGSGRVEATDDRPRAYEVIVKHSRLWTVTAYPPAREPRESDRNYQGRCDAIERTRIERARHEGIHIVHYDVPPSTWKAHDLEALMGLAYKLLPTYEPRWRESGAIRQAKFASPAGSRTPTVAYCLQVARGDYAAHLRLPVFPTLAVAEWLATRRCEIDLRHPVMKLELVARGWRCVAPEASV